VNGRRAGSIAISRIADDTAFLNFVLVDPAVRGRGIAGAMMEAALSHARANGFPFVRLETYSVLNDARALYARRGFEIVETTPGIEKYGQRFDVEFWLLGL
jgi:GNAT superfamily N-acetyltransferase